MLKFKEEFFNEQRAQELAQLIIAGSKDIYERFGHWLKDYVVINENICTVDFSTFLEMSKMGNFYYITARDEAGNLVGCSTYFLTSHLHARQVLVATNNFFYIKKPLKINALLDFTEKSATFKGANFYEFSVNIRNNKMHKFLKKHRNYNPTEVMFSKKLESI